MRTRLTSTIIDATPTPNKPLELRDSIQRGLVLRVQPGTGLRTWYVEYRLKGRKSRVKLGSYPETPVSKARNLAAQKRGELLQGKDPGAKSRAARTTGTIASLLDEYEAWVTEHRKSGAITVRRLRGAFQPIMNRRVASLTAKDVDQWRTWRAGTRVKGARGPACAKSRNQDLRMLKAAFNWGVETGRIEINPLDELKPKRERESERPPLRALTDGEERALLNVLDDGDELYALIVLSLDTGARRAELLTLDWTEVSTGAITVLDGKAKSGKRRTLPLTPRARAALDGRKADTDNTGRVFRMKPASVFRAWRAACEAAGIENPPRWHDLRATFATRLANENVPLHTVMALLGHSSLKITQDYLRMDTSDLTGAIAALAAREVKS